MNTYYCDFGRGEIQRAWDYAANSRQLGHNVRVVVLPKSMRTERGPAFRVFFSATKCNPKRAVNVKDVVAHP